MTTPRQPLVLTVDDDPGIRRVIKLCNDAAGRRTVEAEDTKKALVALQNEVFDLVVLDIQLPDGNGLDLLKRIREIDANLPVIMATGNGSVASAVDAMRTGAVDFLEKPFNLKELEACLDSALQIRVLRQEVQQLRGSMGNLNEAGLIGCSDWTKQLIREIRRVAQTPLTTVLIEGESGSGKEVVARALHLASARRNKRFLAVNCAALSETLLEAELFGYEKGSFTGANSTGKQGLFHAASGGTLLLDEIGEMSLVLQTKLLRVLQERQVRRVGGIDPIPVDVRIVASTNRSLKREVAAGRFRKDLYYRLNVVRLITLPLRARPDDIPVLAQHFLDEFLRAMPRPIQGFSKVALEALCAYEWPGNIRELKNVIERAVVMAPGPRILIRHLALTEEEESVPEPTAPARTPPSGSWHAPVVCFGEGEGFGFTTTGEELHPGVASGPAPEPTAHPAGSLAGNGGASDEDEEDVEQHQLTLPDLSLASAERELIKLALRKTDWNRSRAASLLGMNRSTVYEKLKTYGIRPPAKEPRKAEH